MLTYADRGELDALVARSGGKLRIADARAAYDYLRDSLQIPARRIVLYGHSLGSGIAVPQVLFITSRDNRRYRDGLGKNFRMGTLDVARSLAAPKSLCVAGSPQSESLKEE